MLYQALPDHLRDLFVLLILCKALPMTFDVFDATGESLFDLSRRSRFHA